VLEANKENIALKKDNFELNFRHSQLSACQKHTERKIATLQDKKKGHAKDMETNRKEFEREATRLNGDVERVKNDLKSTQLEASKIERDLQNVQRFNA
jgi:seryl-tRNA synthetase